MKIEKIIRILKKPSRIILFLSNKNFFFWMNDKIYLKMKYKLICKRKLDLENPKTFNEKLQWLKLYDRDPNYTKMVDKYEAKKYASKIIGEEYIIPTLGVYDKFKDIDFDKLPKKFVIKPTHTSGNVFICKDREKIDYKKLEKTIKKWLKRKYYKYHREWPYKNVKPRIIVEKYMATENQKELIDYKFFCFNGEPKFIYVSQGLSDHSTARISFANMNYKMEKFKRKDYKPFETLPKKPVNFEKMKELAKILSKDIPFLRVDFYEIDQKIYFSELTFYPGGGYIPFDPDEYDSVLGKILELPKEKGEEK